MKTKTLKQFIEKSHINSKLIRAAVRQFGGFEHFQECAPDVTNHGIDGGFHGFIYYTDTVAFAKKQRDAILELARDLATDIGEGDEFGLIAGFNCLKSEKLAAGAVAAAIYQRDHEDKTRVLNAMAWFAGEEVARSWCDLNEQ